MTSIFKSKILKTSVVLAALLWFFSSGCGPVAGNYPPARLVSESFTAEFEGPGYQFQAGHRLGLEKVQAELVSLGTQGYSRYDPQVVKSVANRNEVPVGLLADRSVGWLVC